MRVFLLVSLLIILHLNLILGALEASQLRSQRMDARRVPLAPTWLAH